MAADLNLALSELLGISGGTGDVKKEILSGDKELWAPKPGKLILPQQLILSNLKVVN